MIVVTAAFPFIPADITLAHIGSTYLPADIYHRFQKVFAQDSILVSGIDVHSIQVSRDGRTRLGAEDLCRRFESEYRRIFEHLDIRFDVFERTDHPIHLEQTRRVFDTLCERGWIDFRTIEVKQCRSCGAVPPRRLLLNPKSENEIGNGRFRQQTDTPQCPYCGCTQFESTPSLHCFLLQEPYRRRVSELARTSVQGDMQKWIQSVLRNPLPDWNISRDNQVGIPIRCGDSNKSLYLWFESLIGYTSMAEIARVRPSQFIHFFGKNILYYHAISWPIILEQGIGIHLTEEAMKSSIRGFLNIQKSTAEFLNVEKAIRQFPPDYLRFYIAWRVPDSQVDFILRAQECQDVCNRFLCHGIGNLLHRVSLVLQNHSLVSREPWPEHHIVKHFYDHVVPRLKEMIGSFRIRAALQEVIRYVEYLNQGFTRERLFLSKNGQSLWLLAFMGASLLTIVSPFVPGLAATYQLFDGWKPGTIHDVSRAPSCQIRYEERIWTPINSSGF